jgi:hypothetical protein
VRASAVVVGEVTRQWPQEDREGVVWDCVELAVDVVLKGHDVGQVVAVRGSPQDGEHWCVTDKPAFAVGDRTVAYLSGPQDGYYIPVGGHAGAAKVASATEERQLIRRIQQALRR